jgi:hypothetical protein
MQNDALIKELTNYVNHHIRLAEQWKNLPIEALNARPAPNAWSALECLEHLNRYGDFYIPELQKRLKLAPEAQQHQFKPGILGNYFAMSMLPKAKLNRMKTFASMNPAGSLLTTTTIARFINQQYDFLHLLEAAKKADLNRTKTAISISTWLKLKLGDTLRVVIYHNERHMQQAQRACSPAQ